MKLAWTWFIFPRRQTAESILVGIRDDSCGRTEYKALREAGSQVGANFFYEAWITSYNCSHRRIAVPTLPVTPQNLTRP